MFSNRGLTRSLGCVVRTRRGASVLAVAWRTGRSRDGSVYALKRTSCGRHLTKTRVLLARRSCLVCGPCGPASRLAGRVLRAAGRTVSRAKRQPAKPCRTGQVYAVATSSLPLSRMVYLSAPRSRIARRSDAVPVTDRLQESRSTEIDSVEPPQWHRHKSLAPSESADEKIVSRIFVSWNRLDRLLRQIEGLRRTA